MTAATRIDFVAPLPDNDAEAPKVWTPTAVVDLWRSEGPLVHEPTGIARLDNVTGGGPVYGSRVYVVGAPDAAKTALVVQMLDTYARRGIACGILAVDEEPSDVMTRLAQRAGWLRRDCEERTAEMCDAIAEALGSLPVRLYGPEHTIETAAADLDAFARGGDMRAALFVDSIQACRSDQGAASETVREGVSANVAALRAVATRYRLIGVSTSEMNRNAYRSIEAAEATNDMAAGKESGAIEFSARIMLALRSVKGETDLIEVHVVKNKHGPGGDRFHLKIDRRHMTLAETDAPPTVDKSAARDEGKRRQVVVDAGHVALAIAGRPGLGKRDLYAALAAAHGSFSHPRADAAVARLGAGVVLVSAARGGVRHFVDGSLVGADIVDAMPLEQRPTITSCRPPAPESTVPDSADRPGTVPRDAPSECPTVTRAPPMGGRGTGRSIAAEQVTVPDGKPSGTVKPRPARAKRKAPGAAPPPEPPAMELDPWERVIG